VIRQEFEKRDPLPDFASLTVPAKNRNESDKLAVATNGTDLLRMEPSCYEEPN
jgi:hypothetical protein